MSKCPICLEEKHHRHSEDELVKFANYATKRIAELEADNAALRKAQRRIPAGYVTQTMANRLLSKKGSKTMIYVRHDEAKNTIPIYLPAQPESEQCAE